MRKPAALLLMCVMFCAASAGAAEKRRAADVTWHTDVSQAWKQTQENRRPLLVFVTHENCVFCTRMKKSTLADRQVAARIDGAFVPLLLDELAGLPAAQGTECEGLPGDLRRLAGRGDPGPYRRICDSRRACQAAGQTDAARTACTDAIDQRQRIHTRRFFREINIVRCSSLGRLSQLQRLLEATDRAPTG